MSIWPSLIGLLPSRIAQRPVTTRKAPAKKAPTFDGDVAKIVFGCPESIHALLLARPAKVSKGNSRLLVESIHIPADREYEVRSQYDVRPAAAFRLPLEKRARQEGLSLVYCHSHPTTALTGLEE
jgi:hypothetical protein